MCRTISHCYDKNDAAKQLLQQLKLFVSAAYDTTRLGQPRWTREVCVLKCTIRRQRYTKGANIPLFFFHVLLLPRSLPARAPRASAELVATERVPPHIHQMPRCSFKHVASKQPQSRNRAPTTATRRSSGAMAPTVIVTGSLTVPAVLFSHLGCCRTAVPLYGVVSHDPTHRVLYARCLRGQGCNEWASPRTAPCHSCRRIQGAHGRYATPYASRLTSSRNDTRPQCC